ncbi:TetR family transcriptional regulator [Paenibacillus sp. LMG 31456]|uniref:TetR family transcriptional regulator n=1 Tax=Paenibacillus foliorum TaxID=2654974 RepID=A0A972GTT5_9BACL|nr:TetR/AcrR family transcriptional regulator [Paenibacillus foliorum]NOU94334.1 TetR family transcriptional regulator [Paenibacillus foliorum]
MAEQSGKLALQSQEWIRTALFQIMEKKEYSHISITEIADRAGLARQTFYRNFQGKDEILLNYLEELMKGLWQDLEETSVINEEILVALFRNWRSNIPSSLIHNIVTKDRKIRQLIHKSISDSFDELFVHIKKDRKESADDTYRLYAHKSLSATVHLMLIEWTLNDFQMTPEEIGGMVSDLTASIRSYL